MPFEHWLAFAAASFVLVAIPGPTVTLVVSYALAHGRKSAAATVAGVALGDFTAMTASMAGLGVLLATFMSLFDKIEEDDDVQNVYSNLDIPDELLARLPA